MDGCSLLLVEAGIIRGETAEGLVRGAVLATARSVDGSVGSRPGDVQLVQGDTTTASAAVCYLIDRPPAPSTIPSGYELRTADSDGWLASRRPPEWEAGEWVELLTGQLGPWAMLTDEHGVASLCHSARLTTAGAEAGVFTAARHRGRGLARTVTAAWADQLWDRDTPLFYSHADDNISSRRVAEGLDLRPLGRLWFLLRREPRE
jgi:RimJ/RimL family protein N-acetyltransferase